MGGKSNFRFCAQFIRKSVNHRVIQFHFNPSETLPRSQKRSYASALGYGKHQRRLERLCNGNFSDRACKKFTEIANVTKKLLLHSGIMQCLVYI